MSQIKKMEVKYWDGGLTPHEVEAIEKIRKAFCPQDNQETPIRGKGWDALKALKSNSMFPWKGYAGFRLVNKGKEGEFDLVIVTHCNVLIIELKHWNGDKITCYNEKWFLGNREQGRSPVSVTRNKQYLLKEKLDLLKDQFTNEGFCPQVHFLIVMTGNADFSGLPENEKRHVLNLEAFLALNNQEQFNQRFRPHPNSQTLNQDFAIFDQKVFGDNQVKPRTISITGYVAQSEFDKPDFQHPQDIYREYLAKSENTKLSDIALLRRWDFDKIDKSEAKTPDGRYRLVSREYDVLQYIKSRNLDLYQSCLHYKNMPQRDEITAVHTDVFELYPQQKRFNQFVGGYFVTNLNTERRLGLVKLLLDKFAKLHKIGIAHRDLGQHSIWLSADDKIMLSGFATAYFPSEQTVGDIRRILEVSGDLASDCFPFSDNSKITPYHYDVRSLAILAWHIIVGMRISPDSLQKMQTDLSTNEEWYISIFEQALSDQPFENAEVFLEAFDRATPEKQRDFSFDLGKLETYYQDINHSRTYREDEGEDFIVESSEKEVYRSNGLLIKAWLGQDPKQDKQAARIIWNWLENIAKLSAVCPDYIPKIHNFGIAQKSSSLFVASDFIEGQTWSALPSLVDEIKLILIKKLVHSIEHLHGLGLTHGDLKPDNVMVVLNNHNHTDSELYLLDILDFSPDGQSQFNTEYSPIFEHATEKQRDNFAVMKMTCELLGIKWNEPSDEFADIAEVVQLENSDNATGFISLARFRAALEPKAKAPEIAVDVGGDNFNPLSIYPENGELFVQFNKSRKYPKEEIDITFLGLGGKLTAVYTINEKKFTRAISPLERDYISKTDKEKSVLSVPIVLKVSHAHISCLNELSQYLAQNELFQKIVEQFIAEHITQQPDSQSTIQVHDEADQIDLEEIEVSTEITPQRPRIKNLWQAILATETEALPAITANGELQELDNGDRYIPYDSDIDPTDQFQKDEVVEAIGRSDDGEKTFKYGVVDIGKSQSKELYLKKSYGIVNRIEEGTPIYLQSVQNKASYHRRKNALQRILGGESVIENLVDYFDENCQEAAIDYGIKVADEQFTRYDREGHHGEKISLNKAQRKAFQRLISYGPLSLLQGPPGTGKTEFIAAFVHYLFEQQHAKNILLVSQSHEAVNTAAERIRRHCQRLETPLDIVRFSNRETADSEILEDVFSFNLVSQKRHQLDVDKIHNIRKMGRTMGLPENYLAERAKLVFEIGAQIRRYEKIVKHTSQGKAIDEDERCLLKEIECGIYEQAKQLNLHNILEINAIMPELIKQLDARYDIQPVESAKAGELIDLTRDMLEALSNTRANYDEFLARSRQLVVGTCVGIGQRHIGIADNVYDWVIVDEAARSISSELAIAMQSGTRVLLVGDHKQLPPLYSDEHKNALARYLGISKRGEELDQILGSDFERVFLSPYGKQTCASLKTQYRMAPAIGSLVSACFYDGLLENGKTNADIPNIYSGLPESFKSSVTWLDTTKLPNSTHTEIKGSYSNEAEAQTIIDLLIALANDETFMSSEIVQQCLQTNSEAIGVICMYAEQKRLIRKRFREKIWSEDFEKIVKIDSVDSYQGKENRVIILSLTRHDKKYSTGFLYLPNRINVALSRAMDKLIIVGAASVWEHFQNNKKSLGKVLNFIKQHSNTGEYQLKLLRQKGSKK